MTIAVFNLKGGVGKSSLAFNLAHSLNLYYITNDDSLLVKLLGKKARYEEKPKLYENAIYDLGGFSSKDIAPILKNSDLVIIPTFADYLSMQKTKATIAGVEKLNTSILVIVNALDDEEDLVFVQKTLVNIPILPLKKSKVLRNSIEKNQPISKIDDKLSLYLYRNSIKQYNTVLNYIKEQIKQ